MGNLQKEEDARQDAMKAIDRLIEEQTLSGKAAEGIQALRTELYSISQTVQYLRQELADSNATVEAQNKLINELRQEITEHVMKESNIKSRELAVVANETKAAVAEAQSEAYKYAMETVFKPATIRKTIQETATVDSVLNRNGGYDMRSGAVVRTGEAISEE